MAKIDEVVGAGATGHKKTDFSIERLLRKDVPPIITINIEDGGHSVEQDALSLLPLASDSDHSQLQFHSDPESQMTNQDDDEECDKDEDPRFLTSGDQEMGSTFSWLTCTRFKPPKLPRTKKRAGCKRYGRGPRIPFAPHQIAVLESTFSKSQYLSSDCIHRLADTLHLSETRVKIWFQNRRARYRREKEVPGLIHQFSRHSATMNMDTFHPLSPVLSPDHSPKSSAGSLPPRDGRTGPFSPMYLSTPTEEAFYSEDRNDSQSKRNILIPDLISLQIQHHRHAQQLQYFLQQQRLATTRSISSAPNTSCPPTSTTQQQASILHSALQSSSPQAHSAQMHATPFQSSASNASNFNSIKVNDVQNPVTGMTPSQISRLIALNPAFASMPFGLSFQ